MLKIYKTCKIQDYEIDFDPNNPPKLDPDSLSSSGGGAQNQNRISWLLADESSDPIMPHLFERAESSTLDKETNTNERLSALFNFYPPQSIDDCPNVESRLSNVDMPPGEHACNKILVKCTQLKFELEVEPVWASMALYDLKEKRKCSENFAFDLNSDTLKQMLNTHQTHQDASTQAKSCIFNITYPSPDLYIVIRIDKVLQQGDIGECVEPYVKAQQQSHAQIEKLQASAAQFCERLGKYRMPFVWTAINILSILNNMNGNCSNEIQHESANNNNSNNNVAAPKSSSLDRRLAAISGGIQAPAASGKANNTYALKNAYESFRKAAVSTSSSNNNNNSNSNGMNNGVQRDSSATRRSNSIKETKVRNKNC